MRMVLWLNLVFCLFLWGCSNDSRVMSSKAELHRVLPVESSGRIEPSGLVLYNKRLLTVADKNDDRIFEIVVAPTQAKMSVFLEFKAPARPVPKLDFEGITYDGKNFYLASEMCGEVLEVTAKGACRWLPMNFKEYGTKRGFFKKHNAGLEGITVLPQGRLLLAAEREPRGLLEAQLTPPKMIGSQHCEKSSHNLASGVSPDFAGLCCYKGRIWAIFRNAHQIVELRGSIGNYRVVARHSFAHVLLSKKYRYENMKYGIAEGLAVDDDYFYVVVDSNRMARAADPKDHRPLLLILKRP